MRQYLGGGRSYAEVGAEFDVNASTLSKWVSDSRRMVKKKRKGRASPKGGEGRSESNKLKLLLEAAALGESDKGEFLRRHGLRDGDLERFERETTARLQGEDSPATKARLKRMERELTKTTARLREAEALLELQKKIQALWVDRAADEPADGSDA